MGRESDERRAEFEEIAVPHVHALYGFALRFTRRPEEAEDLAQETLLRAYRFFGSYERGTNIRAWLFKILRNLFINKYRKNQREPEAVSYGGEEASLDLLINEPAPGTPASRTPEQVLQSGEVDAEVERAIADLPEEYRTVLLLSSLGELSYKEIASTLSVPIGTVMSRLHRARRMMQASLMEYALDRGLLDAPRTEGGDVIRLSSFRGNRRK